MNTCLVQGFPSDMLVQKDIKVTHFRQSCFGGVSGLLQRMEEGRENKGGMEDLLSRTEQSARTGPGVLH